MKERNEAVAEDAFQVYVGDLPSPRIIEVVRPKELQVPQWRRIASPCRGEDGNLDDDAESSEDDIADETYERRHLRTLERAITAARTVARKLAAQERQKQLTQAQLSSPYFVWQLGLGGSMQCC